MNREGETPSDFDLSTSGVEEESLAGEGELPEEISGFETSQAEHQQSPLKALVHTFEIFKNKCSSCYYGYDFLAANSIN